jgi:hypothetical protein
MDKNQLLSIIKDHVVAGNLTADDLRQLANEIAPPVTPAGISPSQRATSSPVMEETPSNRLTHIFYGVGVLIVLVGVIIFIAQNWDVLGSFGRVLVTLGVSLLLYMGAFLFKGIEHRMPSQLLFAASAALAPVGVYVLLDEASFEIAIATHIFVGIVLAAIFGAAFVATRRNILVLVTTFFLTLSYGAVIAQLLEQATLTITEPVIRAATLVIGAVYVVLAWAHHAGMAPTDSADAREKHSVEEIFYAVGTLAILAVFFSYEGFFDLLFIPIVFGALYASLFFKSKAMLLISGFFLGVHLITITALYFANSIGWPIALIFSGIAIIGVGYFTFYLNKRFLK